ncbi:MAG: DsbA family protein [Candidatus Dormibacteraeota bacterium]|nr:DsbA family protein [Candidatus Dormibacteraeota bacterium]
MTWLPYELHPEVPIEGMSREDYFPPEYLSRIAAAPWRAMAEAEGLVMKPAGRLINTRLALAAAEFARAQGKFDAMHLALFRAFWEQTGDISTVAGLKSIGAACGLDADDLGVALDDGRYEELLDANRREATQVGINGIPAHVFGKRYLVMGAQPYEVLTQVVEKVASEKS